MQINKNRIILASKSKIRKKLLEKTGLEFIALDPEFDEVPIQERYIPSLTYTVEEVEKLAKKLAFQKTIEISKQNADQIIIGCDQILLCNGTIYNKPKTSNEALDQLLELSGKEHYLITSTLCTKNKNLQWDYQSRQKMKMKKLSLTYINNYIKEMGEKIYSIVGCYEIENVGINLFEKIGDDLFTIQGISIIELLNFLREDGYIK
tara:strand:+ start:25501 stop:26118 length:618 start_codon:yes stop_codon:yes gene_type:complete